MSGDRVKSGLWDENPFLFENGMNLSRATAPKNKCPEAESASDSLRQAQPFHGALVSRRSVGAFLPGGKYQGTAPTPFENSYSELLIMQHDVQQ